MSEQTCCGASKDFSGVTHLCTKRRGHDGAHTSGSASWGAHDWTRDDPRWPSLSGLTFCAVCGVVQRGDGRNGPCKGPTKMRPLEQFAPVSAAPAEPLTDLLEKGALHCGTCGRRFFCNICPDCAGKSRDERAEGYKAENKALRAQLATQQAALRESIAQLKAYGDEETQTYLRKKMRDEYQFYQGWNAALDRVARLLGAELGDK